MGKLENRINKQAAGILKNAIQLAKKYSADIKLDKKTETLILKRLKEIFKEERVSEVIQKKLEKKLAEAINKNCKLEGSTKNYKAKAESIILYALSESKRKSYVGASAARDKWKKLRNLTLRKERASKVLTKDEEVAKLASAPTRDSKETTADRIVAVTEKLKESGTENPLRKRPGRKKRVLPSEVKKSIAEVEKELASGGGKRNPVARTKAERGAAAAAAGRAVAVHEADKGGGIGIRGAGIAAGGKKSKGRDRVDSRKELPGAADSKAFSAKTSFAQRLASKAKMPAGQGTKQR